MKRRITVEQLQELTPEQQRGLFEWSCNNESCDVFVHNDFNWNMPLLSIGQMIELLDKKLDHIISPNSAYNSEPDEWQVFIENGGFWDGEELTDALWQAVKGVL